MILPSEHADGPHFVAAKFPLGRLLVTHDAFELLTSEDIKTALSRHAGGDWGDRSDEDKVENELALKKGFGLLSVYLAANGTTFWVITAPDRSITTVLLPSDD